MGAKRGRTVDMRKTPEPDAALSSNDEPASQGLKAWFAQNGFALTLVAVVAGLMWRFQIDPWLAAKVALGLGFIIFIHELGHFLAAKWCDVHVQTFSVGFGSPLPGCSFQRGETTYKIAVFPVGGYVKMVGEGTESDDSEDDPRSFKNKTVGQRMLIISAGVVMNLIFAAVCFVAVFNISGVERQSCAIGNVDAGAPAWKAGLRPGTVISKIGSIEDPFFEDLMHEVMNSRTNQPIPLVCDYGGTTTKIDLEPIKNPATGRPMIGIAPAHSTTLRTIPQLKSGPVVIGSAAAHAVPEFAAGDRITATSDPSDSSKLKPLSTEGSTNRSSYFEMARRLALLAGREVVFAVDRVDGSTAEIHVPPAYHTRLGLTLTMGPVKAVRVGSTAEKAGIISESSSQEGDILTAIEVKDADGKTLRFANTRSAKPTDGVREQLLDPIRLPFELRRWADTLGDKAKSITVTVERSVDHRERKEVRIDIAWDDTWRFDHSTVFSENSPQPIDELGLAYVVNVTVADVEPGSPAAVANVQKGDRVKAIQFYGLDKGALGWTDVEATQAAFPFGSLLDGYGQGKVAVKLQRGQETVEAIIEGVADESWPVAGRGLLLETETRLEKADGIGQALGMGLRATLRSMQQIYQSLLSMLTGRVEFAKNASGPIGMAGATYNFAAQSTSKFVYLLALISVNLAVINFLPIPVLDGGHMFFLLWEKAFGKPPPERIMVAAALTGLALIVSLMAFVTYLDIKRLI
ncbi:MAG: site-2 protease family protein [Gemmataceae bacterium]